MLTKLSFGAKTGRMCWLGIHYLWRSNNFFRFPTRMSKNLIFGLGLFTQNTNFVSYDWILCRTTEFCAVQLNFVPYDQMCVVQPNLCCLTQIQEAFQFVSYDRISCHITQILCHTT
jgi:hypothetical protein